MGVQTLVSTMHQKDRSLVETMNIQTDAIIVNQCDRWGYDEFDHNGRTIRLISTNERGVGLSRNTALMRATSQICLFADDDVSYDDGYEEKILSAFRQNPRADVIVFNLVGTNPERPVPQITSEGRLRTYNLMRYETVRIAAVTESLRRANVHFSLLFGGGARYGAGEDSLFLLECLRIGLKIYRVPESIGRVSHDTSTWFHGYGEKYFVDKGAFFEAYSPTWSRILCAQFALRKWKLFQQSTGIRQALRWMGEGRSAYRRAEHNNGFDQSATGGTPET